MQDEYVGDIGDFLKYTLLRVAAGDDLRLGVHWYRTLRAEVDRHDNDGGHLSYLHEPDRWRRLDPHVFDRLAGLVGGGRRTLVHVREEAVLGEQVVFFETPLSWPSRSTPQERKGQREAWHGAALACLAGTELVFLDPDNGVRGRTGLHGKQGPKYTAAHEAAAFVDRGQTVVCYVHRGRETAQDCVDRSFRHLRAAGIVPSGSFAVHFERRGGRAFLFFGSDPDRLDVLRARVAGMITAHHRPELGKWTLHEPA